MSSNDALRRRWDAPALQPKPEDRVPAVRIRSHPPIEGSVRVLPRLARPVALGITLAACGPDYSPNTYATNAVQQANKVDHGVIVGVREVGVSASGTAGAAVGGAAGGIAGAQAGSGATSAFGALGGALVGGIAGSAAEHVVGDTRAFEYIIRKLNGDLLSVTQKDAEPLTVGQKVLVIAGNQARVVPDYTVPVQEPPKQTAAAPKEAPTTTAPPPPPVTATPLQAPDQPKVETGP